MATYRYVVADVFTDRPLAGNQLAVFTDAREIPEEQLQPLAREINFSETIFVYKPEGEGHARVRIFTPTSELDFAGHPVLGTAFVLAGPLQLAEIRLETGAGLVPIVLDRDDQGRIVFGRMSQPIPKIEAFDREAELLAAVGIERSELPVELYDLGIRHVYVGLPSEDAVAALEPDLNALVHLTGIVGVNCFAGSGNRWKSRMFAPADGVAEDPATGSAAGPLAVHLARHGRIEFGQEIEISQGAEVGRPSTLYARAEGTPDSIEKVECGGSAVIVARAAIAFQFQSVPALSLLLVDSLRIDYALLGTLVGLYMLPGVVFSLPGGVLGQRFGDKRIAVLGLGLMAVGGLLVALAPSVPVLTAGRLCSGIGGVLLNIILAKMVTDWFAGREIVLAMALLMSTVRVPRRSRSSSMRPFSSGTPTVFR